MEREARRKIPKGARYPLFLLGLVIIIFGGLGSQFTAAPVEVGLGAGVIGFICLIVSVALR